MVLTMLSALARCGLDPWDEAARLNELPREMATKRLTLMLSGQSRGQWAKSATADIASRLTALLPVKQAPAGTVPLKASPAPSRKTMLFILSLILLLGTVQVSRVLSGRERSPPIEQAQIVDAPQTPPAPLAK